MVRRRPDRNQTRDDGESPPPDGAGSRLVVLAGFALGGCGGGGEALTTGSLLTATRTPGTVTRTTPIQAATTAETSTETSTETRPVVIPPRTVTEAETQTVTTAETQTETVPVPLPVQTTSEEPASSSSSDTSWAWILLGAALAAGLLIAFLLWRRHRAGAADWGAQTADLNRRCLIALDEVLAKGSVVTGQIEALAAEMRSLEARAPDDPSRAAAARVRSPRRAGGDARGRQDAAVVTATQRGAVAYSSSMIREQAGELRAVLLPPSTG